MSTAFRFDSSTVARRLFRVPLSKQTRGWISFSEGCPRQSIYLAWPNWTYPEREGKKEVPKLSDSRDVYRALTDYCVILHVACKYMTTVTYLWFIFIIYIFLFAYTIY